MWLKCTAWLCLSLVLGGCGSLDALSDSLSGLSDYIIEEDNAEPPNELVEITPEVTANVLWQERVGVGNAGMYLRLVPAVLDEKIIAADRDGIIQARNRLDGELLWEVETEQPISAGPGLGSTTVLVGTSNAEIIALNIQDGTTLWNKTVSSEVLSIPKVNRGIVVIRTVDGRLIGLDENTGEELWLYERSVPPLSLRGTGAPLIDGERVYVGYASGKFIALRLKDGKVEWESNVAVPQGRSELERLVDLDADPVIIDDVIYIASFQAGIFAISARDGQVFWWRKEISSYAGLAADWRYLYLSDEASDVWAVDQRNGSALWKQTDLHRRQLSTPAVHDEYLVVGDFEGYLHWLSQYDGRQVGRIQIEEEPILATPLVVDDVVYAYGKDGTLAALTVEPIQAE